MHYISGLSELEVTLLYVTKSRCPTSIDKGDQSKFSERITYESGLEKKKKDIAQAEKTIISKHVEPRNALCFGGIWKHILVVSIVEMEDP